MSQSTKITNTIFKSNKILFETKDDDYRYVKSTSNIKQGEILLIEHCYCNEDFDIIPDVIRTSPELFDNLYPRTMPWTESFMDEPTSELAELCREKAQKNSFGDKGMFSIGLDISRFNHSNTPTASVNYLSNGRKDVEVKCYLQYVYAHCDINIDEEITIWYGKKYFGENIEYIEPTFKIEKNYINTIASQYVKKDICSNIMGNHMCIYYGLYLVNDMICPTNRFLKYFTENEKKECNMKNIANWVLEIKKRHYTIV
jgi:hypothetical protein